MATDHCSRKEQLSYRTDVLRLGPRGEVCVRVHTSGVSLVPALGKAIRTHRLVDVLLDCHQKTQILQ